MSTSCVIQNAGTTRHGAEIKVVHPVTSAQDSANSAAITVSEIGTVVEVFGVQIKSTGNVFRAPQGAVTWATNVVTVADTGLAENEEIVFTAVGYTA
jgi:hypothetical protein